MKKDQSVKSLGTLFNTDYLAWRVANVKKRESEESHNRVYNDRPRLRSEMHH